MKNRVYFFIFISIYAGKCFAISMVYNFRIAQITRQPIDPQTPRPHSVIALPFLQWRKKYDDIKQNFIGALGSYINRFGNAYFRIDGAVSHIHEKSAENVTTFKGTETDDLLFTVGYEFIKQKQATMTFSVLTGIPTHRLYRLQHIDFGYSLVGLGMQLDGSTQLGATQGLLFGGRYIRFFPRCGLDTGCESHTFNLGNIGDILVAYRNNWDKKHGVECGYTFRARFGAHCFPPDDEIIPKTNYLRSNFYAVYKYRFLIREAANRIMFYTSYGFDHYSKIYGNKYIVTAWASWQVSF